MPPPRTGSIDRCFLCCEPVAPESRSKEHFVPRCFYEEGRNEERWARSIRALKRPEAEGLKERLMSGIVELPGGAAALTLGTDRMIWVLAKIVKGLCWRDCGTLLGPETHWTVRRADYEQAITMAADWCVEVPSTGDISPRGAVLLAKGLGLPERKASSTGTSSSTANTRFS